MHPPRLLSAWSKQEIDNDEDMFPSNSPFLRHVLVSTGKKDWPKDVASVKGSLAQMFEQFVTEEDEGEPGSRDESGDPSEPALPNGCWQTVKAAAPPTRLFVGNASHISSSNVDNGQNVMLFPDYTVVSDVPDTTTGAADGASDATARWAFNRYISHRASARTSISKQSLPPPPPSSSSRPVRSVLPHRAVVVLCSHHKRDARCGIAAPMLAEVLRRYAESYGWEVDERGDDVGSSGLSTSSDEETWDTTLGIVTNRGWGYIDEGSDAFCAEDQVRSWRKLASGAVSHPQLSSHAPTLGIFYTSHIGKHKYSGNVIVYLPNGAGVWYGRVDPLDGAGRVFEQTILKGKIIPEYLRAGINLYRGSGDEQERVSGSKAEMQSEAEQQGILRW